MTVTTFNKIAFGATQHEAVHMLFNSFFEAYYLSKLGSTFDERRKLFHYWLN